MTSKDPRPLPEPGEPTAAEPGQQSRERIEELEKALRANQTWASNYEWTNVTLANIREKCREVLRCE